MQTIDLQYDCVLLLIVDGEQAQSLRDLYYLQALRVCIISI